MQKNSRISRRAFLGKSATTAFSFTVLPSYLALGKKDSAGNVPPSQRLNLGCVGVGNRANSVITSMCKQKNAMPVAFTDVDYYNSERAAQTLAAFPDVRRFDDFRMMLDTMGDDIDAVIKAAANDELAGRPSW